MSHEDFQKLLKRVQQVQDLGGAAGLLGWDQRTIMPAKGTAVRAERLATLAGLAHEIFTSDETGDLLDKTESHVGSLPEDAFEASLWRIVKRDYDKQKRIPTQLSEDLQRAANLGYEAWHVSRAESDYSQFQDALQRNIDLNKQVVSIHREAMSGVEDDYDILLDDYEPGMKTSDITRVFDRLKEATKPLVQQIAESGISGRDELVHGQFATAKQDALVRTVVQQLGFADDAWRLDVTAHPFASSMATSDIRITTKFEEDYFNPSFFGTMHEFGHGLYERQVSPELERTPLASGASMMWHESQSRMWENLVGRGRPFWTWALPKVQEVFPEQFGNASADEMYAAVNAMGPSLIRIEADELTYNLHIILRFELERDLFSGSVTPQDLPEAWNTKISDYFSIDVPNDAQGVLQDVHWGSGSFGYFPTYALGNVLSAMLWEKIIAGNTGLLDDFEKGDFSGLRTWLGENIHQYGSKYMPMDLLDKVLGVRQLNAEPLVNYLTAKVNDLYG
jgi:carboxypeptidase Taq